jgi:hypothetical protein
MPSEVDIFLSAVRADGAFVESVPSLVTVFGGPVSSPQSHRAGIPPVSQRDAFVAWTDSNDAGLRSQLLIPESYADWKHFDTYPDLIRFEEDLAYLTSAVVIFLEAPGAIAELGAFSQIEPLKRRLVVVVEEKYHETSSFISLGPLRQLDARKKDQVCIIPFGDPLALPGDVDAVLNSLNAVRAEEVRASLDVSDRAHHFSLALDYIALSEIATFGDVKKVFEHFGLDTNENRLKQLFFALTKSELVTLKRYSGQTYYLPKVRNQRWVTYKGRDENFHRPRISARIFESRGSRDLKSKAHDLVFVKGDRRW